MCSASARRGSAFGPRLTGANAASSAASRWRRQVLKDEEYTPSRRISAPISPGLLQRSAASRIRRLSALEKCLRRARGTTSGSDPDRAIGAADPGASSVALRAPCDAPGSDELFTACIGTLGCWLIVIPTSLLTDFSGVGAAGHVGTGGRLRMLARCGSALCCTAGEDRARRRCAPDARLCRKRTGLSTAWLSAW